MPITVTTRASKGAPLTNTEMDANLNSLARDATEGLVGNSEVATTAEVTTGTDDFRYITALKLATRLTTLTDDVLTYTDHGGGEGTLDFLNGTIIIKYGTTGAVTGDASLTVAYPTAFPVATLRVLFTITNVLDSTTNAGIYSVSNFLPASFDANNGEGPGVSTNPFTFDYIAIGN